MDKILQGTQHKEMQVTNDGATILKAIGVDNPAAKILVGTITSFFDVIYAFPKLLDFNFFSSFKRHLKSSR